MKPRTPADCLSIVRAKLSEAEYTLAVTRIEQLVAAEREMVQIEMDEAMLSDLPDAIRHYAVALLATVTQSIRAAYCSGLAHGKDTMDEAHRRRAGTLLHKPLSAEEAGEP